MNKKVRVLNYLKNILVKEKSVEERRAIEIKKRKYLSIKEKEELAMMGQRVPICVGRKNGIKDCFIAPIHQYIPDKNDKIKIKL